MVNEANPSLEPFCVTSSCLTPACLRNLRPHVALDLIGCQDDKDSNFLCRHATRRGIVFRSRKEALQFLTY
jgi:hypothetical protein